MSAPVPAMQPCSPAICEYVRTIPAQLIPRTAPWAHLAYLCAQALAASDGHRRRVRKGPDGRWYVEHARPGREVLR